MIPVSIDLPNATWISCDLPSWGRVSMTHLLKACSSLGKEAVLRLHDIDILIQRKSPNEEVYFQKGQ